MTTNQAPQHLAAYQPAQAPKAARVVWIGALTLASLAAWANFATLDEVSTAPGKVIPASREQVIQSLEGGILERLNVRAGQTVAAGEVLAQLGTTKAAASVGETESRLLAARATAARLAAEVSFTSPDFPAPVRAQPALVKAETFLFESRRASLRESTAALEQSRALVRRELALAQDMVKEGAASQVEVLRLQRQEADLALKIADARNQYQVKAREELAKVNAEIAQLEAVATGREDSLDRLTVKAPVRSVVKDIEVNTVGGVVQPGGKLMTLVPLGDELIIEARLSPRDVAYIAPGMPAMVKITAYDYSIFGGLDGEVVSISPDTIQDEVKRDEFYYRVNIRTKQSALRNAAGREFPIAPGMVAIADIKTGQKTVWQYLVKPLNKAGEALRER